MPWQSRPPGRDIPTGETDPERCQVFLLVAFDLEPWGRNADGVDSGPGKQPGEPLRVCSTTVADRTVLAVSGEVDHLTVARLACATVPG